MAKAKVFQFKTKRNAKIKVERKKDESTLKEPEEEIGLIHGQIPGSSLEWRVALALDTLKLNYSYQVPLAGGRLFRGGQVLDFLVYTVPLPTPLFVQGDYWHGGTRSAESKYKVDEVKRIMGSYCADPVEIWEHEALTKEQALDTVRRKLL